MTRFPDHLWRTSSWSGTGGGQCVQAAITEAAAGLRDSKNPAGGELHVSRNSFASFVSAIRTGTFDHNS